MTDIFSIGHSNHPVERFLALLRAQGVNALADVRSTPYSRRVPQFGREHLSASLRDSGIAYVFLGVELGGKRPGMNLADIAATDAFARGLDRLHDGASRHRVAFMCAEREPLDCHRTLLVARHLRKRPDLAIHHILADGSLEDQAAVERRLVAKMGEEPLPLVAADPREWDAAVERAYEARGGRWGGPAQPSA